MKDENSNTNHIYHSSNYKYVITKNQLQLFKAMNDLRFLTVHQIDLIWSMIAGKQIKYSRAALKKLCIEKKSPLCSVGKTSKFKPVAYCLSGPFKAFLIKSGMLKEDELIGDVYTTASPTYHDSSVRDCVLRGVFQFIMNNTNQFDPPRFEDFSFYAPIPSSTQKKDEANPRFISDLITYYKDSVYLFEYDNLTEGTKENVTKAFRYIPYAYSQERAGISVKLYFVLRDHTVKTGVKTQAKGVAARRANSIIQKIYQFIDNDIEAFDGSLNAALFSLDNFDIHIVSDKDTTNLLNDHFLTEHSTAEELTNQQNKSLRALINLYKDKGYATALSLRNSFNSDSDADNFMLKNNFDLTKNAQFTALARFEAASSDQERINEIGIMIGDGTSYKNVIRYYELCNSYIAHQGNLLEDTNKVFRTPMWIIPTYSLTSTYFTMFDMEKLAKNFYQIDLPKKLNFFPSILMLSQTVELYFCDGSSTDNLTIA